MNKNARMLISTRTDSISSKSDFHENNSIINIYN